MRNYIAPGQSVDLVADSAYVAGQGYVVGSIFGVAANNADEDTVVTLHLTGIYEFPGEGDIGDTAYWNDGENSVSGDKAGGLFAIGSIVGKAAGTVQVRLDGVAVEAADTVPATAAVLTTPVFAYTQGDMDDGGKFVVRVAVDAGPPDNAIDIAVADAADFDIDDFVTGLNSGLSGASASKSTDGTKVVIASDTTGYTSFIDLFEIAAKKAGGDASTATVGFSGSLNGGAAGVHGTDAV